MQSSMTAAERIFALSTCRPSPCRSNPRVPAAVRGEIVFDRVWFGLQGRGVDPARRVVPHRGRRERGGGRRDRLGQDDAREAPRPASMTCSAGASSSTASTSGTGTARPPAPDRVVCRTSSSSSGSVEANITLGADIPRAAVEAAAVHVNADRFIQRLGVTRPAVRERGFESLGGPRASAWRFRRVRDSPASSNACLVNCAFSHRLEHQSIDPRLGPPAGGIPGPGVRDDRAASQRSSDFARLRKSRSPRNRRIDDDEIPFPVGHHAVAAAVSRMVERWPGPPSPATAASGSVGQVAVDQQYVGQPLRLSPFTTVRGRFFLCPAFFMIRAVLGLPVETKADPSRAYRH